MRSRAFTCFLLVGLSLPVVAQTLQFPKQPPTVNGMNLTRWNAMNSALISSPPAVALEISKTGFKASFPENLNSRSIYSAPPAPITFRAGFDHFLTPPTKVVMQFSSSPAAFHGSAPFAGWEKPFGLLDSATLDVRTVANPSQNWLAYNVRPNDTTSQQVSARQRLAMFDIALPNPKVGGKGSVFFARIVPVTLQGSKPVATGPSSNWVRIVVEGTAQEQANAAAQQAIAQTKAKAEAEGKLLVTKQAEAQKAIRDNYDIRLLSYIPPKMSDDFGAENYFVAHSSVSFTYEKTKATNIGRDETYSVSYIRNLLNSNKTWNQELWEVTSAALNQQNGFLQAAKMGLVDGLCLSIQAATGVKVGADVRAAMLMGVNFALAYCGIPPSLPNIDQLYSRGVDYLAATIADYALEQATGVAMDDFGANPMMTMAARDAVRERAKEETAKMIEKLTKPAPLDPQVPESWGTPAPFFRRRPAMMYLEVRLRPGGKPVTGLTWQGIELKFLESGPLVSVPNVAMPRSVGSRVRVPVAIASAIPPQQWIVNGFMPHPNVAPGTEVGQPFYKAMSDVKVMISAHHRLTGTGQTFTTAMNTLSFKPHLVNARPIPEGRVQMPGAVQKALDENSIALGPQNYVGRVQYWPFSVN